MTTQFRAVTFFDRHVAHVQAGPGGTYVATFTGPTAFTIAETCASAINRAIREDTRPADTPEPVAYATAADLATLARQVGRLASVSITTATGRDRSDLRAIINAAWDVNDAAQNEPGPEHWKD